MCTGPNLASGFQMLIDSNMQFLRNSHPVYMRLRNFPQSPIVSGNIFAQLGLPLTPATGPTGTQDILIDPPPSVRMLSQHDIGMSMGKLTFGARTFLISATWLNCLIAQLGLSYTQSQLEQFWRAPNVVGLVLDSQLFEIAQIAHEELGGVTMLWTLDCNSNQQR